MSPIITPLYIMYTPLCTDSVPTILDESYAMSHDTEGVLGMANKGRNTNASQFYITLKPAPWMDGKYVAFGYVHRGTSPPLCGDMGTTDIQCFIERFSSSRRWHNVVKTLILGDIK